MPPVPPARAHGGRWPQRQDARLMSERVIEQRLSEDTLGRFVLPLLSRVVGILRKPSPWRLRLLQRHQALIQRHPRAPAPNSPASPPPHSAPPATRPRAALRTTGPPAAPADPPTGPRPAPGSGSADDRECFHRVGELAGRVGPVCGDALQTRAQGYRLVRRQWVGVGPVLDP